MDERLKYLFSRVLIGDPNEINHINREIGSIQIGIDIYNSIFNILIEKNEFGIHYIAGSYLKLIIKNSFDKLENSLKENVKSCLLNILKIKLHSAIYQLIVESIKLILEMDEDWDDFINFFVCCFLNESLHMIGLLLLSKCIKYLNLDLLQQNYKSLYNILKNYLTSENQEEKYIGFKCIVSISKYMDISLFYDDLFQFYKESIYFSYECSQISILFAKLLNNIEFEPCKILQILLLLLNDENISDNNKISLFRPINIIFSKYGNMVIKYLPNILNSGIFLSERLFNDDCYVNNFASSVSFNFLKSSLKIIQNDILFNIIFDNLKDVSTPNKLFAYLHAISKVPEILFEDIYHSLSFIKSCIKINILPIQEISSIILDDLIKIGNISEYKNEIIEMFLVTFKNKDINEYAMDGFVRMLFFEKIDISYMSEILSFIFEKYLDKENINIHNLSIIGLAGFVECYKENCKPYLKQIFCILFEESKTGEPRAIEAISYYLYEFPNDENFIIALNFYVSILNDINCSYDLISSTFWSLSKLASTKTFKIIAFLPKINKIILEKLFDEKILLIDNINYINKRIFNFIKTILNNYYIPEYLNFYKMVLNKFINEDNVFKPKELYKAIKYYLIRDPLSFIDFFEALKNNIVIFKLTRSLIKEKFQIHHDLIESLLFNAFNLFKELDFRTLKFINCILLNYDFIFPLELFTNVVNVYINNNLYEISPKVITEIISIFEHFLIKQSNLENFIEENANIFWTMIRITLKSISTCNCKNKPTQIEFFNYLISSGINLHIDNFYIIIYDYFSFIFNMKNDDFKYYYETIYQSITLLLYIITAQPNNSKSLIKFLSNAFNLLYKNIDNINDNVGNIYRCIFSLPNKIFEDFPDLINDLFVLFVKTVSLQQKQVIKIDIEQNKIILILSQIYKTNEDFYEKILNDFFGNEITIIKNIKAALG